MPKGGRIDSEVTTNDQIIAIMGPTGAGKSNFIDTISGAQWAGNSLESVTQDVRAIRLSNPNTKERTLVLVDMPGFDDTTRSNMEVLKMIADWLGATYAKGVKLAGIIYVHCITDNRMAGTPLRNLHMFAELCGENAAARVALVTTMWDGLEDRHVGEAREKELTDNYWRGIIKHGATTHRFANNLTSALKIIRDILEKDEGRRAEAVLLQEELVDLQRRLNETQVGQALYSDLQNLLWRRKETVQALVEEAKKMTDPMMVAELEAERKCISKEFERVFASATELKISFGRRIWLFFANKLTTKAIDLGPSHPRPRPLLFPGSLPLLQEPTITTREVDIAQIGSARMARDL